MSKFKIILIIVIVFIVSICTVCFGVLQWHIPLQIGSVSHCWVHLSLDEMIDSSDIIVLCNINDIKTKKETKIGFNTYTNKKYRYIEAYTDAEIEVKDIYKGEVSDNSIICRSEGYKITENGIEQTSTLEGTKIKEKGEFIIFFVYNQPDNTYKIMGGGQSVFKYNPETRDVSKQWKYNFYRYC